MADAFITGVTELRNILVFISLLAVQLMVAGCAMPVPLPEKKVISGSPVTPHQIDFLSPGTTTQIEVVGHLGQPSLIWEDVRIHVYQWEMRQGLFLWAVGGGYSGAAGMTDIPKHYLLLLQFDTEGKLMRFEQTTRPLSQPLSKFLVDWFAKTSKQPQ